MQKLRLTPFLFALSAASLVLIALAALLQNATLASWFQHPQREPGAAFYTDGAIMLRIMLACLGVILPVWALIVTKQCGTFAHDSAPLLLPVSRTSRFELASITLLLLAGSIVRMTRLGESLWYDEVAAWMSYGQWGPGAIVGNFADPSNHVLHTLLTWFVVTFLGTELSTEVSLRLPAFIASLASIVAVYALARRLAGRHVAMLAGVLMTIWPVCVLEGVEARGYSMMMLFSALMSLQLLRAMDAHRPLKWLLYAVLVALGAWAHMVTVFVAVGHGAWLVWLLRRGQYRCAAVAGLASLFLAAAITLALYAPLLPEIMAKRAIVSAQSASQPGVFGAEGLHALLQLGGSWLWYAALPGISGCIIGCIALGGAERSGMRHAAAVTLLGVPAFLGVVIALNTWVYARFALFVIPGAALLTAFGLFWLWRRSAWAAGALGALILAGSALDLAIRPVKQPLREAADYVLQNIRPEERVLVISIANPVMNVYLGNERATTSYRLGELLDSDLAAANPAWIIMLYPEHVAPQHKALLANWGFTERARFDGWVDWGQGDVVVYAR